MMLRAAIGAALLAGVGLATTAAGQTRVLIPGGVLRGTVTDTTGGAGLSYALVTVVRLDRRSFANERGAFAIAGLKPGPERLRVQQIGYAPLELNLMLVDPGKDAAAVDQLIITLGARVQVLPDLVVTAADIRTYRQPESCVAPANALTGGSAQLVIDQAVTNADRIVALEQDYPFIVTFEHVREARDSTDAVVGRWVDTIPLNPAHRAWYRRGAVLPRPPLFRPQEAHYFTMGDLARVEFQRAHCVWYIGTDSTEAGPVHRLVFEPAPGVKSADWAGMLQFDRESFQLARSDAWLVQVGSRAEIRMARCAVRYGGDVPTIIHERIALCQTDLGRPDGVTSRDVYRVLSTRFLGQRPGENR